MLRQKRVQTDVPSLLQCIGESKYASANMFKAEGSARRIVYEPGRAVCAERPGGMVSVQKELGDGEVVGYGWTGNTGMELHGQRVRMLASAER